MKLLCLILLVVAYSAGRRKDWSRGKAGDNIWLKENPLLSNNFNDAFTKDAWKQSKDWSGGVLKYNRTWPKQECQKRDKNDSQEEDCFRGIQGLEESAQDLRNRVEDLRRGVTYD